MKKVKYYGWYVIVLVWVCLLVGCERKEAVLITDTEQEADYQEESVNTQMAESSEDIALTNDGDRAQTEAAEEEVRMLLVHICGAVIRPGVYELAMDARFFHAVEAAGGFTQEADTEYLNMAQALEDGMKIYIPTREEISAMNAEDADPNLFVTENNLMADTRDEEADDRIDINTANVSELCTLPGIGEAKAQSILAYREQVGKYRSIEEIMNVEGIKEGLYEKIKDSIKVS